jgi:hypothetical protein
MLRIWFVLFTFICMAEYPAIAQPAYSKSTDLPPLRISFAQLQDLLDKGASLIRSADGPNSIIVEEMELRNGETKVTVSGHNLKLDGTKVPQKLDSFQFTARTQSPDKITRLWLDFEDFHRRISLEGQSPNQVDAIFSTLKDGFTDLSTPFGGIWIFAIRFTLLVLIVTIIIPLLVGWSFEYKTKRWIFPIVFSLLFAVLLYLLPFDDIFASFLVVEGDSSFISRYAPQITFLSLIVAVIAIPLSYFFSPKVFQSNTKS